MMVPSALQAKPHSSRRPVGETIARFLLNACVVVIGAACAGAPGTGDRGAAFEEYCLSGELDLGVRLQGLRPEPGEWYPTTWCVVTSSTDDRVRFANRGHANPDLEDDFTLLYPAVDRVRIVNAGSPPDVEFVGTVSGAEAASVRRVDPVRLAEELEANPEWIVEESDDGWWVVRWPGAPGVARVLMQDNRIAQVHTTADLPLRGRVPVEWHWTWSDASPDGELELRVDGHPLFRAAGTRRALTGGEAESIWRPSGGEPPVELSGKRWPSIVDMRVESLEPGVHIVRGVRTGFHHLVVETASGLVVVDAPAGWLELHRLPPEDMVPGLGVSGLSERFVDFLNLQWPGVPLRAVILTHAHDDHAGGARAFAAAGARVYAPAMVAAMLEDALNSERMPPDRWPRRNRMRVEPVAERTVLADPVHPMELIPMGPAPHVETALGVHLPGAALFFQSDLHVAGGDTTVPREARATSDCWFAGWARDELPPGTVVHNSHTATSVSVRTLATYLAHPRCGG